MIAPKITQKVLAMAVSCIFGSCTKIEFEVAKAALAKYIPRSGKSAKESAVLLDLRKISLNRVPKKES